MYYVYLLRSLKNPEQIYIGFTSDLESRLKKHNSGSSSHTSKYIPWELLVSIQFKEELKAIAFEKYLKSGSGNVFVQKRLL